MSNLFKGYYTSLNKENVRIIDSNERAMEKVQSVTLSKMEPGKPDEDGFSAGLSADVLSALTGDGNEEKEDITAAEIHKFDEESYNAMIAEANAEIERMQAQAQDEISQMAEEARIQASKQGYDEGFMRAQSEFQAKEKKLHATEERLKKEYEEKIEQMEPLLVETITGVYEHVFHVELGEQREIITYLITAALKKVDGGRNCIVHISKEDYPYVSMQKKQIMSGVSSNTTVDIVEDITLSKNCALIETEGGIFDCGLGTQLSELNRKIRLLSYEKEA